MAYFFSMVTLLMRHAELIIALAFMYAAAYGLYSAAIAVIELAPR